MECSREECIAEETRLIQELRAQGQPLLNARDTGRVGRSLDVDYVKYSLYLDPEQMEWLRAEQERTGAPVSETIRRAIDAYRAAREKPAH